MTLAISALLRRDSELLDQTEQRVYPVQRHKRSSSRRSRRKALFADPSRNSAKRLVDIIGAGVALLFFAPLLIGIAIAIKWTSPGPILFQQPRYGKGNRLFRIYKFRTMHVHLNDRSGVRQTTSNDSRVTTIGRILRKTSLDELPQLINVLRGDMSLVGPRPALPHEVAEFDEELRGRHRVLPGITGLWQVEGRENPEFDVYRRLDLFYVENWSVGFDLAILLATAQSVLLRFAWSSKKSGEEATKLELSPAID